jgi:hypothetical protein
MPARRESTDAAEPRLLTWSARNREPGIRLVASRGLSTTSMLSVLEVHLSTVSHLKRLESRGVIERLWDTGIAGTCLGPCRVAREPTRS